MAEIKPSEVTSILRQQLQNFNQKSEMEEVGTVLLVGDGIARVYGLHNVRSGELVTFNTKNGDEITGIALNLLHPDLDNYKLIPIRRMDGEVSIIINYLTNHG